MSAGYPSVSSSIRRERATKIVLILVFLIGLALYIVLSTPGRIFTAVASWSVLDFVLLGLATFRLGHLVSYDLVMEPLRSPFARTVPDSTGAGDTVEPRGEGVQGALGQLITCPICSGTWISAGLVALMVWFPGIIRFFLWMTAAIALAEIIQAITEALCWSGNLNRSRAGAMQKEREIRKLE